MMKYLSRKLKHIKKGPLCLVALYLFELFYPTAAMALSGGPSQPEVQGFTPIDTSEMVNLFTGDFSYNIPLLDVDGYPINIAYQSGITTDQEASWVGLGWSLNTGVVNRSMRGLPDDFDGDVVRKEFHMKENKTVGVTAGSSIDFEVFGLEAGSVGLSLGIKHNNYSGYSASFSITPSLGPGEEAKMPWNVSLGISTSSDEGASIQPQLSMSFPTKMKSKDSATETSLNVSIGGAFNTRSGLTSLSVRADAVATRETNYLKVYSEKKKKLVKVESDARSLNMMGGGGSWDFSMPTFAPSSMPDMKNIGFSGKFGVGLSGFGLYSGGFLQGFYSRNYLRTTIVEDPAYGYINSHKATSADALMDFNRENEVAVDEYTPAISYPNFTYDLFNASAQGFSGSFRAVRSEIGSLKMPRIAGDPDINANVEVELGFGVGAHVGGTIGINRTTSESRDWQSNFMPSGSLKFVSSHLDPKFEPVYFKEAGEKSVDTDWAMFNENGGSYPVRVELKDRAKYSVDGTPKWIMNYASNTNSNTYLNTGTFNLNHTKRTKRQKRTQVFSYLENKLAKDFGVQDEQTYATSPGHLIGEITTLSADGKRYVFGKPLYNNTQHEVTFATGSTINDNVVREFNHSTGLVKYFDNGSTKDNGTSNGRGLDNYYERVITPKYAHSFMLTSILSSDYIDADDERGPSDGDLGNWTKFGYSHVNNYKWRTPIGKSLNGSSDLPNGEFIANYMEGLRSRKNDDKASYTYGEKDLAYLDYIETKNYFCKFEVADRDDALGVADENGSVSADVKMRKLKAIHLYSKAEFVANGNSTQGLTPLKSVHFVYSYELCPGVPNHVNYGNSNALETGKLTLREIYFTYQGSYKAKFSSYKFNYAYSASPGSDSFSIVSATNPLDNPSYNLKAYDRWGNYKPNTAPAVIQSGSIAVNNSEDPFTIQDRNVTDKYASAWTLKEILLPSGGAIKVTYESDDYAHVQDKQACELYRIVGSELTTPIPYGSFGAGSENDIVISQDGNKNPYLVVELPRNGNEIIGEPSDYYTYTDFKNVFIKSHMKFKPQGGGEFYEYVPGYYEVQDFYFSMIGGLEYAIVKLKPQRMKDTGTPQFNPLSISGLQFGRKYFSKELLSGASDPNDGNFRQIVEAVGDAFQAFREFFRNPNQIIYNNGNGQEILKYKSMIRLKNQNGHKLGGGLRVSRIETFDDWNNMTNDNGSTMSYGQVYSYDLPDGRSSGVATYEPQIGGEDNPFKKPMFVVEQRRGVPDERYFVEEPLGEAFFPSPSVGYSRVTVRNLPRQNVSRNATGKVVHEFYTAKEFPTIARRTDLDNKRHKASPASLRKLLKLTVKDYSTASQGISVEVNDMHGKERKTTVFAEQGGDDSFVSSVEYFYKQTPLGDGTYQLENTAQVINPQGQLQTATIGLFYEIYNDTQEQSTFSWGADLTGNVDVIVLPFIALPIPTVKPGFNRERTMFRSTSTVKVIQRSGIIEKVVATDDASTVTTSNLAYDSETGEVLLTEVNNNFGDKIYNMNFPAYWKFKEMGGAYQNIGFTRVMGFDASGNYSIAGAKNFYVEGDELALVASGNNKKGWVVEVGENHIKVIDKVGEPITGSGYLGKIIRSGYRNMQMGSMASITTKSNPMNMIAANSYSRVLQASAIEYTNEWLTDCECYTSDQEFTTSNPFVLGIKGYWKPTKSYLYLTDRTQTDRNNNTNLRYDGEFTSFSPFYQVDNSGQWSAHYPNWTYTSEVTQFSPHGNELENRDALGRYSAAKFGYKQTLATSVAANSKYSELGFEGFEYLTNQFCGDNDFNIVVGNASVSAEDAHTGKYSLEVNTVAPPVVSSYVPSPCAIGDCGLQLEITPQLANLDLISVSGGNGPYTFEWTHVIGSPQVELWNGNQLRVTGNNWVLLVTATDSQGNTINVEFEKEN